MKLNKRVSKNYKHNFLTFFPRGKKAMMDDMFDFLFTVFAAFFVLMFIGAVLSSSVNNNEEQVLDHLKKTQEVNDYLVLERGVVVQGGSINPNNLKNQMDYIRKRGHPGDLYANNPWVLGTDSSGDLIVLVE